MLFRSLIQLLELEANCVVALNMVDEAGEHAPQPAQITEVFGVPCVATSGRTGHGVPDLKDAIRSALAAPSIATPEVRYPPALIADINAVVPKLPESWSTGGSRDRALALWALNSIDEGDELVGIEPTLREEVMRRAEAAKASQRDIDVEAISARYCWLDDHQAVLAPKIGRAHV